MKPGISSGKNTIKKTLSEDKVLSILKFIILQEPLVAEESVQQAVVIPAAAVL